MALITSAVQDDQIRLRYMLTTQYSHMNKALTMPRATAGNMGAIAIMAGTVVVTGTVVVVVTPPVATPVLPPPVTTVCRSCGRKGS